MKILFQNADTGDNFEFDLTDSNSRVRDIAIKIMDKYQIKKPPIFFTILKEAPTKETFLEEDDVLSSIVEKRLDEKTPIWFRSSELHPDTIYKLRTERFAMSGYKISEISGIYSLPHLSQKALADSYLSICPFFANKKGYRNMNNLCGMSLL